MEYVRMEREELFMAIKGGKYEGFYLCFSEMDII